MPKVWQEYFSHADFDNSNKMLNILTPIIIDGKLIEATIAISKENVSNPDDFVLSYRNILDKPNDKSSAVPKNAPYQVPYKQNLSVYDGLIRGEH